MADKEYTVKVVTVGDDAGARKVTTALGDVGRQAQTAEQQLAGLIIAGRALRVDTSDLEADLVKLRETTAAGVLSTYTAELEQNIEATKAAGGNAAELEARLARLKGTAVKIFPPIEETNPFSETLEKTSRAARRAGQESKDAGDALETFGRKGAAANDAFEGTSRVVNGGAGAIFGFAKAWRALSEAFAVNPVTASLAAVLALLPLIKAGFSAFISDVEETNRQLFGTGERTTELNRRLAVTTDAAKRAGEAMKLAATTASAGYDLLNGRIDATASRLDQLAAAQKDRALAEVDLQESQQLAGAKSDEERTAIKAAANDRRGAINTVADIDARERDEAQAIAKRAAAEKFIADSTQQIASLQETIAQLTKERALLGVRGKELSSAGIAGSDTHQAIALEAATILRELQLAQANLKELTKDLAPKIEAANRQLDDSNNALDVAAQRRAAQITRTVAGGITQETEREAAQPGLRRAIIEQQAREMIENEPDQRVRGRSDDIFKRAGEINSAALAQEGRQAGETMGEAVALAVREIFPQMTPVFLRVVRAEVDGAVKAEIARVESQIKGLRSR